MLTNDDKSMIHLIYIKKTYPHIILIHWIERKYDHLHNPIKSHVVYGQPDKADGLNTTTKQMTLSSSSQQNEVKRLRAMALGYYINKKKVNRPNKNNTTEICYVPLWISSSKCV